MTKLDIAISSIKCSIECSDEEAEAFKMLSRSLNKKTNELMMQTGKISDRLLLFIVLLANANKETKIFNNFEQNIIKLMRSIAPLLNNNSTLEDQLVLANIIKENETMELKEDNSQIINDENVLKIIDENKRTNEETLQFIDEITNFVEKLANNINKM